MLCSKVMQRAAKEGTAGDVHKQINRERKKKKKRRRYTGNLNKNPKFSVESKPRENQRAKLLVQLCLGAALMLAC